MKKIILTLFATAFLFLVNACSSSGGDKEPTNSCVSVSNLDVMQQSDQILFTITSTSKPLYYEISFHIATSNPNPENSATFIMSNLTETKSLSELGIAPGNIYIFYARAICENNNSNWTSPKSLLFNDFCKAPVNLRFTTFVQTSSFEWDSNDESTSYYQVQYGIEGFTVGSGAILNTNNEYLNGMPLVANTTYDFYVRSFCTASSGWSSWSGPYTYLSTTNQNLCSTPTNVAYTIERNSSNQAVGANFTWNYNGENNFEYTIVRANQSVNQGQINSTDIFSTPTYLLSQNTNYHFYVRGVCSNGNRTAWAGPLLVNIGN